MLQRLTVHVSDPALAVVREIWEILKSILEIGKISRGGRTAGNVVAKIRKVVLEIRKSIVCPIRELRSPRTLLAISPVGRARPHILADEFTRARNTGFQRGSLLRKVLWRAGPFVKHISSGIGS